VSNPVLHRASVLVLCGALAAASAVAHDTWLLPDRLTVPAGSSVSLALTSGMAYPESETAIAVDRLARTGVRIAGRTAEVGDRRKGESALVLGAKLDGEGIATLWVDLHPRTLELEPADVEHYLAEIGAGPAVKARWEATPARRWRESYVKHAKSFVRVGEPEDDRSWAEPVGMALELVPDRDPTALRPGDELVVRLLRDGKPLPGLAVGLARAGVAEGTLGTTDGDGRVSFRLGEPGSAGARWLLRATQLRPASGPDLEWESDFTTLTFETR
jgi:uncharacterized GH25 family protein